MADTLQKLFGPARLKLLRLFLFNPRSTYTAKEAIEHLRISSSDTRKELAALLAMKFIKKSRRASVPRYQLNQDFEYIDTLQGLLLNTTNKNDDLYNRLRTTGAIKFMVIAGGLLGKWEDTRLELLVVGERINEKKLRDEVRKIESELGMELRYASLTTDNFYYRLGMNDHLVKDVFDYPHKIVHDKLNLGLK